MSAEIDSGKHERLTDAQIARRIVWIVPALLAVIGFFSNRSLSNIEQNQVEGAKAQAETNKQVAQLSSDVRVIDTRLQLTVVEQIKDLRERVNKLEQTVKTP